MSPILVRVIIGVACIVIGYLIGRWSVKSERTIEDQMFDEQQIIDGRTISSESRIRRAEIEALKRAKMEYDRERLSIPF